MTNSIFMGGAQLAGLWSKVGRLEDGNQGQYGNRIRPKFG